MEGSAEGLAVAAATREAARKRQHQESTEEAKSPAAVPPPAKRPTPARPPPTCTHEVAIPVGFDPSSITLDEAVHGTLHQPSHAGPRAKQYPFTLDPFQQTAIACLERRESVLVAAHTSAGKTVVAEYAIAMAFRDKQRVIYTSPLKALSNQKFRELSEEFGDVGLMTGDVSLNPNASCIVMTTEILRSMIYRGSELLREVAWVVFDEIHYMQDRERGVVWEETIIFLNDECKMVFLSATLANAAEFAAWVAHLHKQPCHIVYTDYRPTPLQHYAYALGGTGLHLVLDEKGNFRSEAFAKVRAQFQLDGPGSAGAGDADGAADGAEPTSAGKGGRGGRGGRGERGGRAGGRGGRGGGRGDSGGMMKEVGNILRVIQKQNWQPVIFFTFARKECELYAGTLKTFDFNTEDEKDAVEQVYTSAIQCLNEEDRSLPAIGKILPMLQRGIAVHHSGLLPILKEVIEILFGEGLIKVLFATETFAMGLNMPARSVVFTALRKWDGEQNRYMHSGEYIQMSGRAGRRGKDDRGICIQMINEDMDENVCKAMCLGKPSPLISSFKLSYYTMLNMLRRMEGGDASMEYVIKNSFQQFQQERALPQIEKQLEEVEARAAELGKEGDEAIAEYVKLRTEIGGLEASMRSIVVQPQHCLQFLRAGRIVAIQDGATDWGYGVIVSVMRRNANGPAPGSTTPGDTTAAANYVADTLLVCDSASLAEGVPKPGALGEKGCEMAVVPLMLPLISRISTLRITIPQDLRPADNRRSVLLQLQDIVKRYPEGLPSLDPVEDMAISDPELLQAAGKVEELEAKLVANPVFQAERDEVKFEAYAQKAALAAEADRLRAQLRESQLSAFKTEARCRTAVLKKLGHVDEEGVVLLKGRAACEIDTADELLTTELMFNGTFNSLDKHQLVALVSCLIPVEKSGEMIKLTNTMAEPLASLQETARHIAEVSRECKLEVDPDTYVESFRPYLMDIMYAWSKGASFADICQMTDIFEGSIIRATRRLDELMQQLARAARVVGDEELGKHIEESNLTIRRDIIFAASLYI